MNNSSLPLHTQFQVARLIADVDMMSEKEAKEGLKMLLQHHFEAKELYNKLLKDAWNIGVMPESLG